MPTSPMIELNNGMSMPQLGFGFDRQSDSGAQEAVEIALETGYRLLDTAENYRNEVGFGRAIATSGLPRADVFVTTKVCNSEHGRDLTLASFDGSLQRLGLDYVDLYLIHWPVAQRDLYVETWQAMEEILADGRARAIGVSNFEIPHLERLAAECETVPTLNQVELHPALQQAELRSYHRDHGIATGGWRPLALAQALEDPTVLDLSARLGRTPAQVVLRWHLQLGNVVTPKSGTPDRIRSNFEIFDFELSPLDMDTIAALESDGRIGPHPDVFDALTDADVEKFIQGVDPKRTAPAG